MDDIYYNLRNAIKTVIGTTEKPLLHKLMQNVRSELENLCEQGVISFGPDHSLTGLDLECRVKEIFKEADFDIIRGREGMEDFVINPPPNVKFNDPIVLEVKSSRKPHVMRDELRQLDDWVFELSKEEEARKHGLGGKGGPDPLAFASYGLLSRQSKKVHHPTPHKGVMIFNGPIEQPFSNRNFYCISPNDRDFVDKRNFCIIPFQVLIKYCEGFFNAPEKKQEFWDLIHSTAGTLLLPGTDNSLTF